MVGPFRFPRMGGLRFLMPGAASSRRAATGGGRRWRREWDSNPRSAINAYTLSKRAPSAARPSLRCEPILAQKLADSSHQLARGERLGDVEVGADAEAPADLGIAALCREHHDLHRPPFGAAADALAYFISAAQGHHDVEQHQVGRVALDEPQGFLPVARDLHLVAAPGEQELERRDDVRLVVGHQDLLLAHVGSVKLKHAPLPGMLSTHMRPPKCSTI